MADTTGERQQKNKNLTNCADLEKAASGACGHFVGNHAILRTFWVKNPVLLTEDGWRRTEDAELRLDQRDLRKEDGEGEWSI